MNLDGLGPRMKAKTLACKTKEELLALAKEEGYELSQEEIDAVLKPSNLA